MLGYSRTAAEVLAASVLITGSLLVTSCLARFSDSLPGAQGRAGKTAMFPVVDAPRGPAQAQIPGAARTGTLVLSVRWPTARTVQFMPTTTVALVVTVTDARGNKVGNLRVDRPAGQTTTTASFSGLPAALLSVHVDAVDASGAILASGNQTVTLVPDELTPVSLVLGSSTNPTITSFTPLVGGQGTSVAVFGTGLPTSTSTYSVSVGGVVVPATSTAVFNATEFGFSIPPAATTGAIVLTVDGNTVATTQSFTTIGGFVFTPTASVSLATGSSQVITVVAQDRGTPSAPVSSASLDWVLTNVQGVNLIATTSQNPVPTTPSLGTLSTTTGTTNSSGSVATTFTAQATGSGWLNIVSGQLRATLSVVVQ